MRKPKFRASSDWDRRFLQVAEMIASWSKVRQTQVGAICVRDRRILSYGFNGLPTGVVDSNFRLEDDQAKELMSNHAESNCISYAARTGVSLLGADLYIFPLAPSAQSASSIIQAGIRRVICFDYVVPQKFQLSFDVAADMFSEAGVALLKLPEDEDKAPAEVISNLASKIPPSLR